MERGEKVTSGAHAVTTHTRTQDGNNVTRPALNNKPIFMAGWLDQSYWPDGIYTGVFAVRATFRVQRGLDRCDSQPDETRASACSTVSPDGSSPQV